MFRTNTKVAILTCGVALGALMPAAAVQAAQAPGGERQQPTDNVAQGDDMMSDIIVTATKQAGGQAAQSAPVAITALSSEQLGALRANDLRTLEAVVPNANFSSAGFSKSINLALRGLGITSSTPSTDPAVGIFVNGVYMGVNQGVLTDPFDLESIEILRGPQGILFGRNVTGGALLLNNKRPTREFTYEARAHIESGPQYGLQAAVSGGLGAGFSARISAQIRKDEGYWKNNFLNNKAGKDRAIVIRPSLRYQGEGTDIVLFYEHGDQQGDGPVASLSRKPGITSSGSNGYSDLVWDSLSLQTDFDVALGNGTITNIAAWRRVRHETDYDVEGQAPAYFGSAGYVKQQQGSNELRYNGQFGAVTVTGGLFGFGQHIFFQQEQRPGALRVTQGGKQDQIALGIFGQASIEVIPSVNIEVGGRFSYERKEVEVANLGRCSFAAHSCNYNFKLSRADSGFTPKVGFNYTPAERILIYGTAQRALRSGGYSLRYNSPVTPVGFGPEKQDAYELGFKTDLFDRRTRLNGAFFYNKIRGLQRDIVSIDPVTSISSNQTRNTADARLYGFELELVQRIGRSLTFNAAVGHVNAKFTRVLFDLNGDSVVNGADLALKLPRAPRWTYNAGLQFNHEYDFGRINAQVSFAHTDLTFFNDQNTGLLPAYDVLNASLGWSPTDRWTVAVYAKNLTNELILDQVTPLPLPAACSCFSRKGRVIGFEISTRY